MSSHPLVVTFGEALLRLSPPVGELLACSRQLNMHVGGAEANVAVGLASLGISARWFSRVSDGSTGDVVLSELKAADVDSSFVIRGAARTGLYFMQHGEGPRPATVTYDRADSAFTRITAQDAVDAVDAGVLKGSSAFVTSGITLALGDGPAAAARSLWDAAAGLVRVFDVNYRATLSDPATAAAAALPYLRSCDVVLIAERDAVMLFGTTDLTEYAGQATIVMTRGPHGALATETDGSQAIAPALELGKSGRIGRGDAFAAGYLAGILRGLDTAQALRLAVASASYKSSVAGDLARLDRSAVEALAMGMTGPDIVR